MATPNESLIGSSVPNKRLEIVAANALAITDTTAHTLGPFVVAGYGNKLIKVYSSLNQSVTINAQAIAVSSDPTANGFGPQITQAAGVTWADKATANWDLLGADFYSMYLIVQASVAPTSGSISIYIAGSPS